MNVTLRPEQERVVSEAISAGLIGDAVDVVDLGIETIRHRLESGAVLRRQQEIEGAVEDFGNSVRNIIFRWVASRSKNWLTKAAGE